MSYEQTTTEVIDVLNELAIPYMVVGSLSSNFYSIPRSTQDADFVIQHLDWAYLNNWCDQHGTRSALETIKQSLAIR